MSRLDRKLEAYRDGALSPRERRKLEARLEDDPEAAFSLRRGEALGQAIRTSWTEGPQAPTPEMLIASLRPKLAVVDRELEARPKWLRFFDSTRGSVQAVPGFSLAAACALAMLYFMPSGADPHLADGTAAASVTEMKVENPAYPIYDLAGEHPLMILEGEDGSTVSWILDQPEQLEELSRLGLRLEGLS